MRRYRQVATAVAVAVVTICSGCTGGGGEDVASLEDASTAPSAGDPAGDFVRCLADQGVTAHLDARGQLVVEGGGEEDGDGAGAPGTQPDGPTEYLVDGGDVSEPMRVCQERVPGYDPFAFDPDSPELAEMQEAALDWVRCARDHGITGLEEPQQGTVEFPTHVGPAAAAALFEACPPQDYALGGFVFAGEVDPAVVALLDQG